MPFGLVLLATLQLARLRPCHVAGLAGPARCGSLPVPENRALPDGRRIPLRIVVVPARHRPAASDPLVILLGGPGVSVTAYASSLADEFAEVRQRRDLVLVDMRGTGGSHRLDCRVYDSTNVRSYFGSAWPIDMVRRCAQELGRDADLTQYATVAAADDLESVREALGLSRIDIYALSYGTRLALIYLRRHGGAVRSVVLQGLYPPGVGYWTTPRDMQRALDGVLADCQADAMCHAAFPNIAREMELVAARLDSAPAPLWLLNPRTGDSVDVALTRDLFESTIGSLLYVASSAAQIPVLVHQAFGGNFVPLAETMVANRQTLEADGGDGLYLSIDCSESSLSDTIPPPGSRSTVFSGHNLSALPRACTAWPAHSIDSVFAAPAHSQTPALLFSGELDPVTPPDAVPAVLADLPNAVSLIVPHAGHEYDGLAGVECVAHLRALFIEHGSATGLDTGCLQRIHRPPFPLQPFETRTITLSPSQLDRFVGRYDARDRSFPSTITAAGRGLRLALPNGLRFLLAPLSTERFRVVGVPGAYVTFTVRAGRVSGVVLARDDGQSISLRPLLVRPRTKSNPK